MMRQRVLSLLCAKVNTKIARTDTHVSPIIKRDEMHRGIFYGGTIRGTAWTRDQGHVSHPSNVSKAIRQKHKRKDTRKKGADSVKKNSFPTLIQPI